MKFHDLCIENFLTLREAKINLKDRGLQLVQGVNDDDSSASSNGAGKSSMVDALCWCLYGVTARDVKGDAVVNLGVKKDCMVSLIMSNASSQYKVTRYRKHKTGKNTLVVLEKAASEAEMPIDLSKGTDTETQKILEKIIGCSHEVFMAAVYSGQEVMPDLPKMKDKELKMLIEESAGLKRIERAYELARERLNTAQLMGQALITKRTAAQEALVNAETNVVDAKERVKVWNDEKESRVKLSEAQAKAALLTYFDAGIARDALTVEKNAAAERIAEIKELLANHKKLETAATAAEKTVRTVEMAMISLMTVMKVRVAEIESIKAKITNAAEEIKKPCKECGTVFETMSVEDFIAHNTKHLEAIKLTIEKEKIDAKEQMAKIVALREKAAAARAEVPEVTSLSEEQAELNKVVAVWEKATETVKRTGADLKAAEAQVELRKSEPNPHQSVLEICYTQLAGFVSTMATIETDFNTAKKEVEVHKAVVKVFGPTGVRAQILDSVTPLLNTKTADYLSVLSDGEISAVWTTLTKSASGDLKEKFSIDVTHSKGGDSFSALSGGEKRKVRIATALALQDLVASRATQSLDLVILDEVDNALDPSGLERLMTILERKSREHGTAIVISHSDLKDWCDQVTTVKKSGLWSSTVEGSLCV